MRFLVPVLAVATLATIALTAQEPIFHTSAQIVTVTVSVMDENWRPISDIKRDDLTVLDDRRPREIRSLDRDELPLTFGMVADTSGTQAQFIQKHRDDLQRFLRQVLHQGDRAFLVSIPGESRLTQDLTDNVKLLQSAVNFLAKGGAVGEIFGGDCPELVPNETNCGSLIWNGVWASSSLRLRKEQGRKAILLLSDGIDTGSEHSVADAIEASQSADAPVYTLASPSSMPFASSVLDNLNQRGTSRMRRLSEETGGGYFMMANNPAGIFAQIEAELRHLYVVTFAIPASDRDGKFHKLAVKVKREGARVRARAGYVAQ
jgi:VWFA-related protein